MSYDELTPKQKRIIERDVKTIFSSHAFFLPTPLEALKRRLKPSHPTVTYKGSNRFLSEKGATALRRLIDLLCDLPTLAEAISEREISNQVQKSYNAWLTNDMPPTGREFAEEIISSLLPLVNIYEFLFQVEGVDLKDQDVLILGSVRVQRSDKTLLQEIKLEGALDRESIYSQIKNNLWLIGSVKGSPDVAEEQFKHRATLTMGILAVCGALLYKGAIWRSHARAVTSPFEHRKSVLFLRWELGGNNPTLSQELGPAQDLPFSSESVTYLSNVCFLKQLAALPDRRDRSELEDAIVRAIYWVAESYRDQNMTMQFVKLWTCAECFFAIDKKEITELNTKGISAVLTFAGFNIITPQEYPGFRRRIKKLYRLRSTAIHRAEFTHIEIADLDDLSHWIAWVIISMVALANRGYSTLRQIHEETSRLDRLGKSRK